MRRGCNINVLNSQYTQYFDRYVSSCATYTRRGSATGDLRTRADRRCWARRSIRSVEDFPRDAADTALGGVGKLAKGVGREVEIADLARLAAIGQLDVDGLVLVWS